LTILSLAGSEDFSSGSEETAPNYFTPIIGWFKCAKVAFAISKGFSTTVKSSKQASNRVEIRVDDNSVFSSFKQFVEWWRRLVVEVWYQWLSKQY
jgi:hypothetical protein